MPARREQVPVELVQHVAELLTCLRGFSRTSERIARQHGLTPQRYGLLIMVKGAPGGHQMATVSELTSKLHLAQSSVTGLIARAERAGLVTRTDAEDDARRTEVRLTRAGEQRVDSVVSELTTERRTFASLVTELRDLL